MSVGVIGAASMRTRAAPGARLAGKGTVSKERIPGDKGWPARAARTTRATEARDDIFLLSPAPPVFFYFFYFFFAAGGAASACAGEAERTNARSLRRLRALA